jgi:hypothetical protein
MENKSERKVLSVLQLTPSDSAFIAMVLEMYAKEMERAIEKLSPSNAIGHGIIRRDIQDAKRLMEIL